MHLFKQAFIFLTALALIACNHTTNNNPQPTFSKPVVDFTWSGSQSAPSSITFTNNTQNAVSYRWDFGNGEISTQQFPGRVTYNQPGAFDVILTATNGDKQALLKKTIVITPNDDPVAHFSYTFKNQKTYAPVSIDFSNQSVNADNYEWDIDGIARITPSPANVVFNQAGSYKIKLVAIKGAKRSPVYEQTINVSANTDPVAAFSLNYHPYPCTAGEEVQFVNLSSNSDSWLWTFGTTGPSASTAEHPIVKFNAPGMYTITLIAKKGVQSSSPRSINLKVN